MLEPMKAWHQHNSGGSLFLSPMLILGWLKVFSHSAILSQASVVLVCLFIFLMSLMAWYRQIPMVIKLLLLTCSVLAGLWVFSQNTGLGAIFLAFIALSLFDKWLWGSVFVFSFGNLGSVSFDCSDPDHELRGETQPLAFGFFSGLDFYGFARTLPPMCRRG